MMPVTAESYEVDVEDFADVVFEKGWTDGFPVFPPTARKVGEIIEYVGRDPGEVIGVLQPGDCDATVEAIAINCVMAGCKPEYVPVVIAVVEAFMDPRFHLLGSEASTIGGPS